MIRPFGMHPDAFGKFTLACFRAKVSPTRVMQTVGTAPASAGTHKPDAHFKNEKGEQEPITGALDLRTRDLDNDQIERLLYHLFDLDFAAWWRHEGSFAENQHIHAIYLGMHLKPLLRAQFWDFVAGKDGLVQHHRITHIRATVEQQKSLIRVFQHFNAHGNSL